MLPQFNDGPRARHHHDPRAMAWELFVSSDTRRAGHARATGTNRGTRARATGFWAGLQTLIGRMRNRR
jgi:hypothetical protein